MDNRAKPAQQRDVISISDPRPTAAFLFVLGALVPLLLLPALGRTGPAPPELDGVFTFAGRCIIAGGAILLLIGLPSLVRYNATACSKCGYDLSGIRDGICPECGTKPNGVESKRRRILWRPRRMMGGSALLILGLLVEFGVIRPWSAAYVWWVQVAERGDIRDFYLALEATAANPAMQQEVYDTISRSATRANSDASWLFVYHPNITDILHAEVRVNMLDDFVSLDLVEQDGGLSIEPTRLHPLKWLQITVHIDNEQLRITDGSTAPAKTQTAATIAGFHIGEFGAPRSAHLLVDTDTGQPWNSDTPVSIHRPNLLARACVLE